MMSSWRWTRPCTTTSRAPITTLRSRSSTLGQITELATPVSSSMVMNTTPGAEPGRWRTSTTPATLTLRAVAHGFEIGAGGDARCADAVAQEAHRDGL